LARCSVDGDTPTALAAARTLSPLAMRASTEY
jgi:hypothetical protein